MHYTQCKFYFYWKREHPNTKDRLHTKERQHIKTIELTLTSQMKERKPEDRYIHSKWWNESLLTWMLRISSSKNKNEIKDNSIQTKTIYYQQTLIKGTSKRCSLKKRHYCLFYFSMSILDTESRLWLQVVWVRVHSLNH